MRINQNALKITCIGDSITQGGNIKGEYTYRYPLSKLLKSKNINVDFIGNRTHGLKNNFIWPKDFLYRDHEGYYGKKHLKCKNF